MNQAYYQITYFCHRKTTAVTSPIPKFDFVPLYLLKGTVRIGEMIGSWYDNLRFKARRSGLGAKGRCPHLRQFFFNPYRNVIWVKQIQLAKPIFLTRHCWLVEQPGSFFQFATNIFVFLHWLEKGDLVWFLIFGLLEVIGFVLTFWLCNYTTNTKPNPELLRGSAAYK